MSRDSLFHSYEFVVNDKYGYLQVFKDYYLNNLPDNNNELTNYILYFGFGDSRIRMKDEDLLNLLIMFRGELLNESTIGTECWKKIDKYVELLSYVVEVMFDEKRKLF